MLYGMLTSLISDQNYQLPHFFYTNLSHHIRAKSLSLTKNHFATQRTHLPLTLAIPSNRVPKLRGNILHPSYCACQRRCTACTCLQIQLIALRDVTWWTVCCKRNRDVPT